jgi:hypothetical protein
MRTVWLPNPAADCGVPRRRAALLAYRVHERLAALAAGSMGETVTVWLGSPAPPWQ